MHYLDNYAAGNNKLGQIIRYDLEQFTYHDVKGHHTFVKRNSDNKNGVDYNILWASLYGNRRFNKSDKAPINTYNELCY